MSQIPMVDAIMRMTDIEVLSSWTVRELDHLMSTLGNGEAWSKSERRVRLFAIETGDIETLKAIKEDRNA